MPDEPVAGRRSEPLSADALIRRLASNGPTLVALSGGVDSSAVASLAFRALGSQAVAVTLTSPAVAASEVGIATEAARSIGISHTVLRSDPLSDPRYVENPINRCYFCRQLEGGLLRAWGQSRGIETYLDGIQSDDLGDERPGIRAMEEHGFHHPLVEAGWTKDDVRRYAHQLGLPNWDRPSNACLSSRIAHGQPVTLELLDRVSQAEEWIAAQGFRRVRVRVTGMDARVEVDPTDVPRLMEQSVAAPLRDRLRRFGFVSVEIDPQGYRSRRTA